MKRLAAVALAFGLALGLVFKAEANPDCGATSVSSPCTGQSATSTDGGAVFTWTFNCGGGDCQVGRFLDGQPWVRHPSGGNVTITAVTPDGTNSGLAKNPGSAADLNPPGANNQGLLACASGDCNYSSLLDLTLPITAPADNGVYVKAEAYQGGDCGYTSQVGSCCADAYGTLTVLTDLQDDGALGGNTFRPSMAGTTKLFLTTSDFDYTRLPSRSEITNATSYTAITNRYQPPYPDYFISGDGDKGRRWAPFGRLANYKGQQAATMYTDLFGLFGTDPVTGDKLNALNAILQHAIDIYGGYMEGVNWNGGAGQFQGSWTPFVLLGTLTTNSTIRSNVMAAPASTGTFTNGNNVQFIELYQIGTNRYGKAIWGSYPGRDGCLQGSYSGFGRYWTDYAGNHLGWDAIQKGTCGDPYRFIDGAAEFPGARYSSTASTALYSLHALIMKIWPEFNRMSNHPPILEFAERMMDGAGWYTGDDVCAEIDPREVSTCNPFSTTTTSSSGCLYFGTTWGHNSSTGMCITTGEAQANGWNGGGTPTTRHWDQNLQGRPASVLAGYGGVLLNTYWDALSP